VSAKTKKDRPAAATEAAAKATETPPAELRAERRRRVKLHVAVATFGFAAASTFSPERVWRHGDLLPLLGLVGALAVTCAVTLLVSSYQLRQLVCGVLVFAVLPALGWLSRNVADWNATTLASALTLASLALPTPSPFTVRAFASAAFTMVVIAAAFTQVPAPSDRDPFALSVIVAGHAGAPAALASRLDITFHGCGTPPTVTANVRAAGRTAAPLDGNVRYVAGSPGHPQWTATAAAGVGVPVGAAGVTHLLGRRIDGCYLRLPQLVGADESALRSSVAPTGSLPVSAATVTVSADSDANLTVVRGAAADQQDVPSRWTCTLQSPTDAQERPLGCRGMLALSERYHDALQNLLLLVVGALFSVTVAAVRRASDAAETPTEPAV
jgi:hypothetical protein